MTVPQPTATAQPSALQSLLTTKNPSNNEHHNLALQIAHNLQHQHSWTHLRIHTSPSHPRPLISGLPPQRLYIHPDEQIQLLQEQHASGKSDVLPKPKAQREWVLPSHLREKWSLRRFGEVFDSVERVPEKQNGEKVFDEDGEETEDGQEGKGEDGGKWREEKPKRLLLATLDDDSTVVYYIVHDGIVKPRQN